MPDVVKFGRYPQESSRPDRIEWLVLDEKDGNVLLVSRRALECKPFDEADSCSDWMPATLRR